MKTKYPIEHFVDHIDHLSEIPEKISEGVRKTVDDFVERFEQFDEGTSSHKPNPGKWSRKEILGHLLDSASNNHQRFVRAQYMKDVNFLSYDQNQWVNIQRYTKGHGEIYCYSGSLIIYTSLILSSLMTG